MLYRQFTSPDRHKEKLAHHTRRIAEQREKVRKLARSDLARGHTGARQLLHCQPIGFGNRRTALEHARLPFARQRGKSQIAHHTKEPLTKCDIHPPLPLDASYHRIPLVHRVIKRSSTSGAMASTVKSGSSTKIQPPGLTASAIFFKTRSRSGKWVSTRRVCTRSNCPAGKGSVMTSWVRTSNHG